MVLSSLVNMSSKQITFDINSYSKLSRHASWYSWQLYNNKPQFTIITKLMLFLFLVDFCTMTWGGQGSGGILDRKGTSRRKT